jgi:hypothetical protein
VRGIDGVGSRSKKRLHVCPTCLLPTPFMPPSTNEGEENMSKLFSTDFAGGHLLKADYVAGQRTAPSGDIRDHGGSATAVS